ncbi:MAG: HD domain-containing protein [Nanoarchaeota archaeon]|nr:HD domain-containing protein [Nanoarchaeota archaeon]
MKLPTEQQCQSYFTAYVVPGNINSHCHKVREVANFIARTAKKSGVDINIKLIDCVALLHDLFKIVSLHEDDLQPNKFHSYSFSEKEKAMWKKLKEKYPNMHEGDVAYAVFKEEFPEMALALKNVSDPQHLNPTTEEMIVKYADLRVFQNNIISLPERLAYLQERYPSPKWPEYIVKLEKVEQRIKAMIKMNPDTIKQKMEEEKN